ncbi:NUDIX hydrolase [Chitinophaga polysaccharea]|uniref:NUDIX hydrolase n=1 Tax=Chitinophaga TaxID=79328 RepID=UPI0014554DFA|nr:MULTISPECIES: NUDIX domain-containing protein [Chitinophaga]NLR61399.1 NUDIX hydrolase [Chitinophaga polysaccharea]NLU95234.1 NUDIX hydrolase [Chitinophaga sp. Ak27]
MKLFHEYRNPSLAVDLVVFGYHDNTLSVLLLNRKEEPFKDCWTLPGGFLQMEETFLDTCSRILQTKLGMNEVFLEQLYSFDDPGRDPRGRVIAVGYYALINPAKFKIVAGSMANDVKWFNVRKLPVLGFDHKHIFKAALQRLKSKILYHPVGFELLDELFTITELHELYECILHTTLDRRNFRRKILDAEYVINTGMKREGLKNRHPELYRFNKHLKKNNFQINVPTES